VALRLLLFPRRATRLNGSSEWKEQAPVIIDIAD